MEKKWFVIRGVFGKAGELHHVLDTLGIQNFYPMRYRKGGVKQTIIPAISNLCFVFCTKEEVFHVIDHLE